MDAPLTEITGSPVGPLQYSEPAMVPGASRAMAAELRATGSSVNCLAVMVVFCVVEVTSIGGKAFAVTVTVLSDLVSPCCTKSASDAPPAAGLTWLCDSTTAPFWIRLTV